MGQSALAGAFVVAHYLCRNTKGMIRADAFVEPD